MRTLGLVTFLAWLAVGNHLLFFPPAELEFELEAQRQFLINMNAKSPIRDLPEVESVIVGAQRMLSDPSPRSKILWVKWSALATLVAFGLWGAYSAFQRKPYAQTLLLLGAILFLARQAIFYPAAYSLLLQGLSPIPWLIKNEYYGLALFSAWSDFVLPMFFVSVALVCTKRFILSRRRKLQPQ